MNRFLLLCALGSIILPAAAAEPRDIDDVQSMKVLFTPGDSGYAAITDLIGKAQKTIRLGAYHFKSRTVADALIAAKARGVDVAVVIDAKNFTSKANQASRASEAGIAVFVDRTHKVHHNKYIVVDSRWVETGSFNYHDQAEYKYAENVLLIESGKLAREYEGNWEDHKSHAVPLSKYLSESAM